MSGKTPAAQQMVSLSLLFSAGLRKHARSPLSHVQHSQEHVGFSLLWKAF